MVKKFSEYLAELSVRDSTGKLISVKKRPIRMASGKVEMQFPGKSGSSGGGGNGQ